MLAACLVWSSCCLGTEVLQLELPGHAPHGHHSSPPCRCPEGVDSHPQMRILHRASCTHVILAMNTPCCACVHLNLHLLRVLADLCQPGLHGWQAGATHRLLITPGGSNWLTVAQRTPLPRALLLPHGVAAGAFSAESARHSSNDADPWKHNIHLSP